jgi:hypothetical protein
VNAYLLKQQDRHPIVIDAKFVPDELIRKNHREASVRASLVGSPELLEAVDLQYQRVLEALTAIRLATTAELSGEKGDTTPEIIADRINKAEEQAIQVANILRKDTGIPGKVNRN